MLDKALSFIAPHYCCGCDKHGDLLCANCINYIVDEQKLTCIVCGKPTSTMNLCNNCVVPYERAWFVGIREGVLQRAIGLFKFERARAGYAALGDLILGILPVLPKNTIIVPIPTARSHVRERGYDHMLLISKYVAKVRKLELSRVLMRETGTKQRQSSARQRISQAKVAFAVSGLIDPDRPYLLIDDVVTTGATVKYAALALRKAGAKHVWVAAIARQTLD